MGRLSISVSEERMAPRPRDDSKDDFPQIRAIRLVLNDDFVPSSSSSVKLDNAIQSISPRNRPPQSFPDPIRPAQSSSLPKTRDHPARGVPRRVWIRARKSSSRETNHWHQRTTKSPHLTQQCQMSSPTPAQSLVYAMKLNSLIHQVFS